MGDLPRAQSPPGLDLCLMGQRPWILARFDFSFEIFILFLCSRNLTLCFCLGKNSKNDLLATPKIIVVLECFLNHIPLENLDFDFLCTLEKMHKQNYTKTSHAHNFCFTDPNEMKPIDLESSFEFISK